MKGVKKICIREVDKQKKSLWGVEKNDPKLKEHIGNFIFDESKVENGTDRNQFVSIHHQYVLAWWLRVCPIQQTSLLTYQSLQYATKMKVYSSNSVINPTYENVLKKLNAIQIQSLGRCTKSHSEKNMASVWMSYHI